MYSHGALYKVLGEMEVRQQRYIKAREIFSKGIGMDPHCAPLYHAAALLEAKLGNLEVVRNLYLIKILCSFWYVHSHIRSLLLVLVNSQRILALLYLLSFEHSHVRCVLRHHLPLYKHF